MKTSRAQSFRLHHMNRTGSLRKTSQSFLDPDQSFKLAALNSVSRGVKRADLRVITGDDLNKLRVEPMINREGRQVAAHCSLMDVRVRYDEIYKQRLLAEKHIAKQKEQINKLQIAQGQYRFRKQSGSSKVSSLQTRLAEIRAVLQQTSTELKVLNTMKSRHLKDRVIFDQRKFDLNKILKYLDKQKGIYLSENMSSGVEGGRTGRVYEQLQAKIIEEQRAREEHIRNVESMIEDKMSLINANNQREAQLGQIASRAIQDKSQDEKHWRMVYLTHAFVNRMLRFKINLEMEKFKIVQKAFLTIKTATGVAEAKTLISKYLSKEAVYGELLSKISDNERVISNLKHEGQSLHTQSKALQAEREVLQSVRIKEQDLHDTVKALQNEQQKAENAYKLTRKMRQWVSRQLKKLNAVNGTNQADPAQLVDAFHVYLNSLSTVLEAVKGDTLYKEESNIGLSDKVVRIMPKKSRKNSSGQEIFDVDEEDVNPSANHDETEYINAQHDELVHSNERFMRQLRKKYEEGRKVLMDKKEAKAKMPRAAQIKKEDD